MCILIINSAISKIITCKACGVFIRQTSGFIRVPSPFILSTTDRKWTTRHCTPCSLRLAPCCTTRWCPPGWLPSNPCINACNRQHRLKALQCNQFVLFVYYSICLGEAMLWRQREVLWDQYRPRLTLSPPNKLSSAKFLVCFNFEGASMSLKIDEHFVWVSNIWIQGICIWHFGCDWRAKA